MKKILVLLVVAIVFGMTLPAMATDEAESSQGQSTSQDAGVGSGDAVAANEAQNNADGNSDANAGDNQATVKVDLDTINTITSSVDQKLELNGDQTNTGLQAIMAGSGDADSHATNGDNYVDVNAKGGKSEVEDSDEDNEVEDSGNAMAGSGSVSSSASSSAVANGGSADDNGQEQTQINAVIQLAFAEVSNTQDSSQMVMVPICMKNDPRSYVEIEDQGAGASQDADPSSGEAESEMAAGSSETAIPVNIPIHVDVDESDIDVVP